MREIERHTYRQREGERDGETISCKKKRRKYLPTKKPYRQRRGARWEGAAGVRQPAGLVVGLRDRALRTHLGLGHGEAPRLAEQLGIR